jgi:hypothetical protein
MSSLTSASLISNACASVLMAMNSTPLSAGIDHPVDTALQPPPPMPTTLMTAR